MRILGGQAKGQRLKTGAGRQVRPTAAAVRKVLFDILGPHLEGTRFLDLFAGYGSVGLEALSRGAAQAVFVERNRQCCRVLAENLHALGWQERGEVLCAEVHRALETLAHRGEQFEVIFADPPYGVTAASECLAWLGVHPSLLRAEGVVVVQHHYRDQLAKVYGQLRRQRQRRMGEAQLTFYYLGSQALQGPLRGPGG